MCKIVSTRKGTKHVFIEFDDEENDSCGLTKLSHEKFAFAKKFHNADFLCAASVRTNANTERDLNESAAAVPFRDPDIEYDEHYYDFLKDIIVG